MRRICNFYSDPSPGAISSISRPRKKFWELTLSAPWLIASLFFYSRSQWLPGAFCSFYFFLTGLRQSHGAQHYTLGLGKRWEDLVLFVLSLLMLGSMHAVQVSHLHHHRHCLDDDDAEGSTARLSWWRALLAGPIFPLRLHTNAWRIGSRAKRAWITAEVAGIFLVILAAIVIPSLALRAHAVAMLIGESMTGFFAVWTVHHGCEAGGLDSRTQRGRWINRLCYNMFFSRRAPPLPDGAHVPPRPPRQAPRRRRTRTALETSPRPRAQKRKILGTAPGPRKHRTASARRIQHWILFLLKILALKGK